MEFLRVPGHDNVFAIGDMAESIHDGKTLPQLAGVALQQGKAVARIIAAEVRGRPPNPFRYFDRGTMATIGRNAAVVDIRGVTLKGSSAGSPGWWCT